LAAQEWETLRQAEPAGTTRTFAMATGTAGLLAVGALILTFTPGGTGAPVAVSATSTPAAQGAALVRLATPIGDGQRALMTVGERAAELGSELDVQLISGPLVTAVIDAAGNGGLDGVMVVSITTKVGGHTIAAELPTPDEIVTVLANPPVTVAFADVGEVDVVDGTPVLDSDGDLVGLCAESGGRMRLVPVTGVIGTATVGVDQLRDEVIDDGVTSTSSPATATSATATTAPPPPITGMPGEPTSVAP
jgi:hypothetical protein